MHQTPNPDLWDIIKGFWDIFGGWITAIGVTLMSFITWIGKSAYQRHMAVVKEVSELKDEFHAHQLHVAETHPTKDEMNSGFHEVKEKLDKLIDHLITTNGNKNS